MLKDKKEFFVTKLPVEDCWLVVVVQSADLCCDSWPGSVIYTNKL